MLCPVWTAFQRLWIPWSTLFSGLVITDSKRQDKTREKKNILCSCLPERHVLKFFFHFQEYCQMERILFFLSNILSAYYRIHLIRRSQNTFQTKLKSLPYFHETLIIGGIYLQWLSRPEELLLRLGYFWKRSLTTVAKNINSLKDISDVFLFGKLFSDLLVPYHHWNIFTVRVKGKVGLS